MYNLANEMLEGYFASEEHEEFIKKNNVYEEIEISKKELKEKYPQSIVEDINPYLLAVFNVGEKYGVMQGVGIGMKFVMECTGK